MFIKTKSPLSLLLLFLILSSVLLCFASEAPQKESKGGHQEGERQRTNNPYFFDSQSFKFRFKSPDGHLRVLPSFTERSELFSGLENYLFALLEANPNTFVVPHHCDGVAVLVVLNGNGAITLVSQETRKSFNIEPGHVIKVPAGTTVYFVNHDNNQKLLIAKLIQPVYTPGQFMEYYPTGGANQQSYFSVFGNEILGPTLNTPREELEKLFGQKQKLGIIRKGTPEQIRALSQHASSPRQNWQGPISPFNLLSQQPLYSNRFGQFFEATPSKFNQLLDVDIFVSIANITRGSIFAPHFNSKATTFVFIVKGSGRFVMDCPHVSMQSQGSQGRGGGGEEEASSGKIHGISFQVSEGDLVIIPPSHTVASIASQNENLVTLGFGIRALHNERNFVTGKENIINQMEREAKELSFGVPAELVEKVFKNNPSESYFTGGTQQEQQKEEGGGRSILDFVELI